MFEIILRGPVVEFPIQHSAFRYASGGMLDQCADLRIYSYEWYRRYNEIRSHGPLGGLSPLQFLRNFRSDKSVINNMKLPENLTLEVD